MLDHLIRAVPLMDISPHTAPSRLMYNVQVLLKLSKSQNNGHYDFKLLLMVNHEIELFLMHVLSNVITMYCFLYTCTTTRMIVYSCFRWNIIVYCHAAV